MYKYCELNKILQKTVKYKSSRGTLDAIVGLALGRFLIDSESGVQLQCPGSKVRYTATKQSRL